MDLSTQDKQANMNIENLKLQRLVLQLFTLAASGAADTVSHAG
jgi:hypothetical protein